VAVLADLQGPKIRLGRFAEGPVMWATGERVRITVEDVEGTHDRVSTTYKQLADDVRPGDKLLVDDGNVALIAVEVEDGTDVVCDVTEGGMVSNNKGLSLPGVDVSVPAMSEKDAEDLEFALRLGVDYIALSFVRHAEDVKLVHRVMDRVGIRRPVIAKIEKPEAVENLEAIVLAFDGVMVARGDLGVEMPLEQVPVVQKRAIEVCRDNAKPVIVATQMLDSMINHSRPTRAEASDVANAVIDGADAVMLSGETSVGKFPVQAVATMGRIITSVEASGFRVGKLRHNPRTPGGAIVKAARDIGDALGAVALVAFTQTGDTARRLSRLQPQQQLLVFTPVEQVQRQMALLWGAEAHLVWTVKTTDDMVRQVDSALLNRGVCRPHDLVIVVAGTPPATPGATNTIRIHHIGDVLRHDA
jgi:pyruvate kinase